MKTLLTIAFALLLTGTCLAFQAHWQPLVIPHTHNPLVDNDESDTVKKTAFRAYMIENKITGKWLRRTTLFQVNTWVFNRGVASIYVNKQEARQVWFSLGLLRRNAEVETFMLVPMED